MDSVTQFALGAAVAGAALGRHTRALRAVLWGGIVATLPDLDVLVDHGDAVRNMTLHRAESHALLWLTLASPLLAWAIAAVSDERYQWRRWWWAVWLALVTHPLLDAMTVYGTQLGLPFTDHPFALGSLFVIDPLATLPLLVGIGALLACGPERGRRWNRAGLLLATAYAAWSLGAQQWATSVARASLAAQGLEVSRLLVTPAPLQTLLWRIVAVGDTHAYEGFWSVCDGARPIAFRTIDRGRELHPALAGAWAYDRLRWFSGDFLKLERDGERVRVTDLRMGQDPYYYFVFTLSPAAAGAAAGASAEPPAERTGTRMDVARGLAWLWPRMWGADLPSPR